MEVREVMECDKIVELLPLYIDGGLEDEQMKAVEQHLAICSRCREEYERLKKVLTICSELDVPEPPSDYRNRVMNAIEREKKRQKHKMAFGIVATAVAAMLLLFIGVSSLGNKASVSDMASQSQNINLNTASYKGEVEGVASSSSTGASMENQDQETASDQTTASQAPASGEAASDQTKTDDSALYSSAASTASEQQRKIIKSAYISIETERFDNTINSIIGRATALNGYVSNSEYDNHKEGERTAHIELKIPQQSFEGYLSDMGSYGKILEDRRTGQDVTSEYIDTETRVKMLKIKEERLMSLLKEAKTLQDMFAIQDQLTDTQIEIERLTGNLKRWDDMVNYSTAVIDVYEVSKIEPEPIDNPNMWQRIVQSLMNSLKNVGKFLEGFIVFIFAALPYLILIAIVVWGVVVFIKNRKKD